MAFDRPTPRTISTGHGMPEVDRGEASPATRMSNGGTAPSSVSVRRASREVPLGALGAAGLRSCLLGQRWRSERSSMNHWRSLRADRCSRRFKGVKPASRDVLWGQRDVVVDVVVVAIVTGPPLLQLRSKIYAPRTQQQPVTKSHNRTRSLHIYPAFQSIAMHAVCCQSQ
jgi:hypothetical protein